MPEVIERPEVSTTLTVTERAAVALGSDKARTELSALVKKSAAIKEVKNTAGRDECHGALMALVKARTTIEKTGKAAREDATKFSTAVIAEQKALIAITQPEELRLQELRDTWDEARAAEKAEADRKERARVEAIQLRIADIRECAVLASQCRTSAAVEALIQKLTDDPLQGFEEFGDEAEGVRTKALAHMKEISDGKFLQEKEAADAKAKQEAEAARLAQEWAELTRQRAEQDERDRKAKAEAEATQKALDDIRKVHEAELQAQRDAIAAEQEAAAAQMRADRQRMADERAELARIEDEINRKAQVARQAEADRIAAEKAEAVREVSPAPGKPAYATPTDEDVINTAINAVQIAFDLEWDAARDRLAAITDWTVTEDVPF